MRKHEEAISAVEIQWSKLHLIALNNKPAIDSIGGLKIWGCLWKSSFQGDCRICNFNVSTEVEKTFQYIVKTI